MSGPFQENCSNSLKKIPLKKTDPAIGSATRSWLERDSTALLVLVISFVLFFKDWAHPLSRIFLSLDMSVLYYPLFQWVHQDLALGRLPLITDLAYHGAPVAAISMAGVLSPALWLFQAFSTSPLGFNMQFLAPLFLFLLGSYCLGRHLNLSPSASLLLAFLWTFNGQRMAQLDHLNVAWACAFFPWAFICLSLYVERESLLWLVLACLLWGLGLLSGHPQIVFLEGLFFLFWALFSPYPGSKKRKLLSVAGLSLGTGLVASPLILFVGENLSMDGFHFHWSDLDRYYHSWTPLNVITLIFPWFFGKVQFDRMGDDYWWQYQFIEMQVAFSIVGLFFILLFLSHDGAWRRWLGTTALFACLMALGKFFIVYPLLQRLPVFSFFRDPARYWILGTWALGLGAAYAWDMWFGGDGLYQIGRKWTLRLAGIILGSLALGWFFLTLGRSLLTSAAYWVIQHWLIGDPAHPQTLSFYLDRLPQKMADLSHNLDPFQYKVALPVIFLTCVSLTVWYRKIWNLTFQKTLLLGLVLADLLFFRMPLGQSFYDPASLGFPQTTAALNRSLPLISQTTSPLPKQYVEMSIPNMNLILDRATLPFDANPPLGRYDRILSDLGWFSWVYKDRDPLGFTHHVKEMRALGLDQIVSDSPLPIPKPFTPGLKGGPYIYNLAPVLPQASVMDRYRVLPWPDSMKGMEEDSFDPIKEAILETAPPFPSASLKILRTVRPQVSLWSDDRVDLSVQSPRDCLLVLQKTFLPGWTARVNGRALAPLRCDMVLMALPLPAGQDQVELIYQPPSLRLGFFLVLLFSAFFITLLLRRLPS